jgi:uncharacterized protein GlcG (DUF336 family)
MSKRTTTRSLVMITAAAIAAYTGAVSALAQTVQTHRLPAALAVEAVVEAVAYCATKGHAVSATVIDFDGVVVAALRGDGAPVHTIEASRAKTYAASSFAPVFNVDSSGAVAKIIQKIGSASPPGTLPFQTPEHMIVRAGGLTIKLGDEVLGAIGVGGAPSADLDESCARAGLTKIQDRIK